MNMTTQKDARTNELLGERIARSYRAHRKSLPAGVALSMARHETIDLTWTWNAYGDKATKIVEGTDMMVRIIVEADPCPDTSWLGEFVRYPVTGSIPFKDYHGTSHFVPANSIEDTAAFYRRTMSRVAAHDMAVRQAKENAAIASGDWHMVSVECIDANARVVGSSCMAGFTLNSLGVVEVAVSDYGLADDAMREAGWII